MLLTVAGKVAAGEATVQLRPGDDALSGSFCLGAIQKNWSSVVVELEGGKKHRFRVRAESDRFAVGFDGWKKREMPDAIVNIGGVRCFTRPRLRRYETKERSPCHRGKLQKDLMARWDSFPAASKSLNTFEVRQDATGFSVLLNGQYVGRHDYEEKIGSLTFVLPDAGEVRDLRSLKHYRHPQFHPLNVKHVAKPGVMRDARVSLRSGRQTIEGVPVVVASGAGSVDVGVVKQMKGSWALECDEHLSRTALDGMPETAHFAVPMAYYTRAYALCAVEPDLAKDPIITARLTRFARSGRGEAISDTTLALPRGDGPLPSGVTKVGTVGYEQDGEAVSVPLLLVELKLKPGEILDLLAMDRDPHAAMMKQPYLDFEFLGKLGGVSAQWDSRHKPDNKSTSAVHVFGATLERSPVELRLANGKPGNIFHNDEKPEMTATLKATRECAVTFAWRIYDVDGKGLCEKSEEITFSAPGEEREIAVPLGMDEPGWYGIGFVLTDDREREALKHDAAFALLGQDTRNAGYDSPYGTWWFARAHYGAGDKEVAGPMMFKAGLRKTTFSWSKYSEEDMAPWKITLNQMRWSFRLRDLENLDEAYARVGKQVDELRERFPHCRHALIFHESFRHYVPDELRDVRQIDDQATTETSEKIVWLATRAAEFYRQRYPDIKLLVGNTSSSASIIAALLRHGFDPKYIDFIGIEAVGQTGMPEKLWEGSTQGAWLAREAARKFGHDLPVTGCYEFVSRTDRNLGPQRQAEWIVRDMLLCHAYRFQHINPAILHDVGNSYFNTLWGAGGLCRRNPLLYPKPAYVAVANLTKVLDQVTLLGRIPTGSTTVYALELRRADGNFAYALWTPRGEAKLRIQPAESTDLTQIGLYGKQERISVVRGRSVDVACSPAPIYLVSPVKIQSIDTIGRTFDAPPNSFTVANRMDNIEEWRLQDADLSLSNPTSRSLPIRVAGDFELAQVDDEEKGRCLELRLNKNGTLPDIVSEYTVMKLKSAVPVSGKPERIGLWVKGDSGWGKIVFEIQDATGALWRTEGSYHDWPGDLSICHDGWRYLDFPIDGSSTERNVSAGRRWTTNSRRRDVKIEFPIKVVGLYVVMNRRALDLAEMRDVEGVLRFRDFGTGGGAGEAPPVSAPSSDVTATVEHGKVYWQEDFSRFDVGPAGGFGEKCVIEEEGGKKHLHGTGWLMGNMAYFGAREWKDYSFRFRFRFTESKRTGFYPLVKSRGKREGLKYLWYYVSFGRDRLSFTCHGLAKELAEKHRTPVFKYADYGLEPLEAGAWYATDIQVAHDRIKVLLSKDGGKMTEIANIETVPGDGGVDILSYVPVDVADIVVQKLSPEQTRR